MSSSNLIHRVVQTGTGPLEAHKREKPQLSLGNGLRFFVMMEQLTNERNRT